MKWKKKCFNLKFVVVYRIKISKVVTEFYIKKKKKVEENITIKLKENSKEENIKRLVFILRFS